MTRWRHTGTALADMARSEPQPRLEALREPDASTESEKRRGGRGEERDRGIRRRPTLDGPAEKATGNGGARALGRTRGRGNTPDPLAKREKLGTLALDCTKTLARRELCTARALETLADEKPRQAKTRDRRGTPQRGPTPVGLRPPLRPATHSPRIIASSNARRERRNAIENAANRHGERHEQRTNADGRRCESAQRRDQRGIGEAVIRVTTNAPEKAVCDADGTDRNSAVQSCKDTTARST